MIGEDVSAFSDRGILHMANFEGPTNLQIVSHLPSILVLEGFPSRTTL